MIWQVYLQNNDNLHTGKLLLNYRPCIGIFFKIFFIFYSYNSSPVVNQCILYHRPFLYCLTNWTSKLHLVLLPAYLSALCNVRWKESRFYVYIRNVYSLFEIRQIKNHEWMKNDSEVPMRMTSMLKEKCYCSAPFIHSSKISRIPHLKIALGCLVVKKL